MNNRTCVMGDCDGKIIARGLCGKHYQQIRIAGRLDDFKPIPRAAIPLEERFRRIGWTVSDSGCWEWNGIKRRGYGMINSGKRNSKGHHIPLIASRVAWTLHYGEIPEDMFICHTCDNPPCVNPDHLFLGTQHENNSDMAQKKRTLNGERRPQSKLTDNEVEEIRRKYVEGGISQQVLGKQYGVSQSAVSLIVSRQRRGERTYPEAA